MRRSRRQRRNGRNLGGPCFIDSGGQYVCQAKDPKANAAAGEEITTGQEPVFETKCMAGLTHEAPDWISLE